MAYRKRAFISFDFDNDEDLRTMLAGQAKLEDSPFDFIDRSVKETLSGDWVEKVRGRIRNTDVVIVLCGRYTDRAKGVSAEVTIAKEEGVPYFLLWGRPDFQCVAPIAATGEKIYKWTWDNLKSLIGGAR